MPEPAVFELRNDVDYTAHRAALRSPTYIGCRPGDKRRTAAVRVNKRLTLSCIDGT